MDSLLSAFTLIPRPLIGGLIIGLSSSLMLLALGRISGISGIVANVLSFPASRHYWRYAFLAGMCLGASMMKLIFPELFLFRIDQSRFSLVCSGLIVGFGTSMGSGCTSGHGVCGLARLSRRSLVATMTFMMFGMLSATLLGKWS